MARLGGLVADHLPMLACAAIHPPHPRPVPQPRVFRLRGPVPAGDVPHPATGDVGPYSGAGFLAAATVLLPLRAARRADGMIGKMESGKLDWTPKLFEMFAAIVATKYKGVVTWEGISRVSPIDRISS